MTTSTQSAADRLRASSALAKGLAHNAGAGQWIVDVTDGVVTIVGVIDGDLNADNPGDYEGYTDVIAYDVSSESTAALMAASRVIVPRQAEQIRVLVEALESVHGKLDHASATDVTDDHLDEWFGVIGAALDAAWALEADDA